ncbi:kinase-like protein [Punctularia strigosozonata HHB-11173 SS5]|uniref:kinase-like protein n=1 Tax=Punctularia strigosozonata (strain HHB-11173) TaxID=741275 RepID=UPI0004417E70|nr:kinase-like protein [Punctularia strigosozonata HHB-11173 SS5]EIN11905.1 kinase-like protein [Punctularia strigosozonata HHB-11173 SS5]
MDWAHRRFVPSSLDAVENTEEYRPGGFHPIAIGDCYANGRYRVLHKLGHGGSSTVWLARDYQQNHPHGRLVALKAMRADDSSAAVDKIPELVISDALRRIASPFDFQIVDYHFLVQGPNGCHRFLACPLAGPSVHTIALCEGRPAGSRRLRGDLARKVAKQTALAIWCMHLSGIVHGDLTASNILFRVAAPVVDWTDEEFEPHAPAKIIEPANLARLADLSLLQERILLIDFGQSYMISHPPKNYEPATTIHYKPPEMRFEGRAGPEADVWALACAIFEIRVGYPLFDPFFPTTTSILRQTVATLGRLPDPWWQAFEERTVWFEDDGQPKNPDSQISIADLLRSIGTDDVPSSVDEGPMIEKCGVRLSNEEVELLVDLSGRMLRYRPEERATMKEVVEHRWFRL